MPAVSGQVVFLAVVVMECYRSPLLTQLFAVVDSDPLILIAYNGRFMLGASIVDAEMLVELAKGDDFISTWNKNMLVCYYLSYTFVGSRSASESPTPAEKYLLGCCGPMFARRRNCDLLGEWYILRIDRLII